MPRCLGDVPIGAGQQHAQVGVMGAGVPYLLPVDHPLVAVEHCRGGQAGEVRPRRRLAEQLAPQLLAGQQRSQKALPDQVGALLEDGGTGQAGGHRRHCPGAGGSPDAPGRRPTQAGPGRTSVQATTVRPTRTSTSRSLQARKDKAGSQCSATQARTSDCTDSGEIGLPLTRCSLERLDTPRVYQSFDIDARPGPAGNSTLESGG